MSADKYVSCRECGRGLARTNAMIGTQWDTDPSTGRAVGPSREVYTCRECWQKMHADKTTDRAEAS
jgi:DNA-directed RNA polymerase subunit RPC12/RpoP